MSSLFTLGPLVSSPEDFVLLNEKISEINIEREIKPKAGVESSISDMLFRCIICPSEETAYCVFLTSGEKRAHFGSDWHKFNMKMHHNGHIELPTLAEFECLSEAAQDALLEEPVPEMDGIEEEPVTVRETFTIFSIKSNPSCSYSIYTEILHPKENRHVNESPTSQKSLLYELVKNPKYWLILMVTSGRFYYAVFGNAEGKFIKHGSCKAYVGRQKQGGSQLIRDRKSPVARSAGSQIRRENEKKWQESIETIMHQLHTAGLIATCSLIFISCSIYYQPMILRLVNQPQKIRKIPFTTYRPTLAEIERCYRRLSTF
jgi:hypothetical protein